MKDNLLSKLSAVHEGIKKVSTDDYDADKQFMMFMRRIMTVALLGVAMICYTAWKITELIVTKN